MEECQTLRIRKTDDELQIAYGEVYAPNVPDTDGDFMTAEEIRKMAHLFLRQGKTGAVDTNHDNVENGSRIVESFIAREDDTLYIPESWVIGMHIPDVEIWKAIKDGEINGFSMQALVKKKKQFVTVTLQQTIQGRTSVMQGANGKPHDHSFEVKFDAEGRFLGGRTSTDQGHFHVIRSMTVVEMAPPGPHNHRYSVMEHVNVEQ